MKYIIALFVFTNCLSQEIKTITDKEINEYWQTDRSAMSQKYPIKFFDIIEKHGGEIKFKYTFLIDVGGRPKDFNFISAVPKSAEVEKNNLKKLVLFHRYKHNENNDFKGATFVEADLRWWRPK